VGWVGTIRSGTETPAEPGWAFVGARVMHSTFGEGTVIFVGRYKGVPAVSIQFEGHKKALEIQYARSHTRLIGPD